MAASSSNEIRLFNTADHLNLAKSDNVLIIGAIKTGKTYMTLRILSRLQLAKGGPAFKRVIWFSPTMDVQEYSKYIDKRDIVSNVEEYADIGNQIFEFQRRMPISIRSDICLIFDDVIGSITGKEATKLQACIKNLIVRGRHTGIHTWIITQTVKDYICSSKVVRSNIQVTIGLPIGLDDRISMEQMISADKTYARSITSTAWAEDHRAVCLAKVGGGESAISFLKIDPKLHPMCKMTYRD